MESFIVETNASASTIAASEIFDSTLPTVKRGDPHHDDAPTKKYSIYWVSAGDLGQPCVAADSPRLDRPFCLTLTKD